MGQLIEERGGTLENAASGPLTGTRLVPRAACTARWLLHPRALSQPQHPQPKSLKGITKNRAPFESQRTE